jgi:hypothetical protein
MRPAGFETTIPASKRLQFRALDRAATGIVLMMYAGLYLAQICPGIRITEGLLYLRGQRSRIFSTNTTS